VAKTVKEQQALPRLDAQHPPPLMHNVRISGHTGLNLRSWKEEAIRVRNFWHMFHRPNKGARIVPDTLYYPLF
jgi:hypothetical protein